MASRRRQNMPGKHGRFGGANGYNAKQKMMNIHFRYSDVVTDYAQALMLCDGRFSLLMSDCSEAELHHLDKIEFEALMARLDAKDRASVLAALPGMPTIGPVETDNEHITSGGSLLDTSSEDPISARGKTPGQQGVSSARPSPTSGNLSGQGSHVNIEKITDSFSVIPEEGSEAKSTPNSQLHPKSGGPLGTGDSVSVASSKSLKSISSKLTTSNGSLTTPRKERRRPSKT